MSRRPSPNHQMEELLTINDVRKALDVTYQTVRNLVKSGKIKAYRIKKPGRELDNTKTTIYFTKKSLTDYINWRYGDGKNDD